MTAQRIEQVFTRRRGAGQTALIAYLTVGDPSLDDTVRCAVAAAESGADLLELGVPFSDPTADGPVIAAAAHRAIQQGGSLRATLEVTRRVRAASDVPIVVFTYYNPVVAFGPELLPAAVAEAGADGLLLVDLPPEEGADVRRAAVAADLAVIPLVAPTTGESREPRVLAGARGFIYYVSLTGVTGSGTAPLATAGQAAAALRARASLPVAVGFGIHTPEQARLVADQGADGVIVGTAIVRAIAAATGPEGRVEAVRQLVGSLRAGLDRL